MGKLRYLIFLCLVSILGTGPAFSAKDFDLKIVRQSVVSLNIKTMAGSDKRVTGVAVSPTMILTTKAAVSLFGPAPKITIDGERATITSKFDEQKLILISYPRGGLTPAILAKSLGQEGRNIYFVAGSSLNPEVLSSTIINLVSEGIGRGAYFDASIAPALIDSDQAAVFNNCGELIGLFDKSIRSKVATVNSLDNVTSVAVSTGRQLMASDECPSEAEKQTRREAEAQRQAEQKEALAAQAVKEAEELAKTEKAAADAAVEKERKEKEAVSKAYEEKIEREKIKAQEDADKQKTEADAALQEAEEQAALKKVEAEETIKKLEQDKLANEKEAAEQLKAQRNQYFIAFGCFLVLLVLVLLAVNRRKKTLAEEEIQDPDYNQVGNDVIIRGAGLSIKVPEELLIRERGVLIGRSAADCDFVLDAPSISRSHIRLIQKDNVLYIEDLGSANGTVLNEKRLLPGEPSALHDNDTLELADSTFAVEIRLR